MENELANMFERYRELMQRRAQLEERLAKAKAEKDSVKQDIYDRVCKEYQSTLDEVSNDLNPLQIEIEESRKTCSTELQEIKSRAKALEEELEEAEFRYRVGEYDESRYSGLETPLKKQLAELSETREELTERLHEIETLTNGTTFEKSAPTELSTDNGDEREQSESAEKPAAEKSRVYDSGELIDLTEWTKELQNENAARQSKTDTPKDEPAVATEDRDALSDLADPSTQSFEDGQTADESHSDTREAPVGFPILIITKGPGAGKKLPLVPMTMTLGREHDNNIELKDEDVARYHARISYKSGSYLLEDLESSSGTWLNDEKITEVTLQHGDKLRVGATEMIVDFE
jgi:hypothetical protein